MAIEICAVFEQQMLPLSCGQRVAFCPVTKSHQKTPIEKSALKRNCTITHTAAQVSN
jgi:hypothetical protein